MYISENIDADSRLYSFICICNIRKTNTSKLFRQINGITNYNVIIINSLSKYMSINI